MYCLFCNVYVDLVFFFFSSRRRHTRFSRDWSSDVCSSDLVDISEHYVFQLAYMPCEIELPPRKEGGSSRTESIEHPFVVYDYKGKRGLAPIDRNRVEVGKDKDPFHVRTPQPLPSMISPRTVRAFLEGDEVDDPSSLYEQALHYLKRKSDQDQDCYYAVSAIHGLGTHFLEAFDVYPYLRF